MATEGQPKTRDAARSRAAILDAAERLFAAEGYEAVTMARIGAEAGVSRGTPGYFFANKEGLFTAAGDRAVEAVRAIGTAAAVRDAERSGDPTALTTAVVVELMRLVSARPTVARLLDQRAVDGVPPHVAAVRDALAGLGPDADRVALLVLSLCWFPVAHPDAARALGVDPAGRGFADTWASQVVSAVVSGQVRASEQPVAAQPSDSERDVKPKKKKKKKRKD